MSIRTASHLLVQRIRRALHYAFGPSREERERAATALAGREYYELYDDRYRLLRNLGVTDRTFIGVASARGELYQIWERLCQAGLLPRPGARLIDMGCGEGANAVHFAELGYEVTGVDISPTAIAAASDLASERAVTADFRVENVLELATIPDAAFDVAIDIGCLHMIVRRAERRAYVAAIQRILRPGSPLFVFDRVSPRDTTVADEEEYILKSITFVEERRTGDDETVIRSRSCGFRGASLGQYAAELKEGGFAIRYAEDRRDGFAVIVGTAMG